MASVVSYPDAEQALKDELARRYQADVCPIILAMMRVECPVDTGVLRQQHRIDGGLRPVAGGYLIRFRAMPYWGVLVARGHGIIRPVHAKALRFVTKQGVVVFTKKVRAVAGNPWQYRTFVRAGLLDPKQVDRPS